MALAIVCNLLLAAVNCYAAWRLCALRTQAARQADAWERQARYAEVYLRALPEILELGRDRVSTVAAQLRRWLAVAQQLRTLVQIATLLRRFG